MRFVRDIDMDVLKDKPEEEIARILGYPAGVLSQMGLAALPLVVAAVAAVAVVRAAGRGEHFTRWQRPRILTGFVVLQ